MARRGTAALAWLALGLLLATVAMRAVDGQGVEGKTFASEGEMLCDPATGKCRLCTCVRIRCEEQLAVATRPALGAQGRPACHGGTARLRCCCATTRVGPVPDDII